MSHEEYKAQVKVIEERAETEKKELAKNYATDNNPYNVGDIITDHMGSVKVDIIQISLGNQREPPQCVYNGIILNKDGSYNKRGKRRGIFQMNIKED